MKARMSVRSLLEAVPRCRRDALHVISARESACSITTSFGDISVRKIIQGAEVVEPGTCSLPERPVAALTALDPADVLALEADESRWRYATGASCSKATPWLPVATETQDVPDLAPLREIDGQVWLEALKRVEGSQSIQLRAGALLGVCREGVVVVRTPEFTGLSFGIPYLGLKLLLEWLPKQKSATLMGGENAIGVAVGQTTITWDASHTGNPGSPSNRSKVAVGTTAEEAVVRVLRTDLVGGLRAAGNGRCELKYVPATAELVIGTSGTSQTLPVRAVSGSGFHVTVDASWLVRHLRQVTVTELGLACSSSRLRAVHAQALREGPLTSFLEVMLGAKVEVVENEVAS